MKLYLARHAQTNYNLQGLANADPAANVHLSEEGIEQAKRLADALKDVNFDAVFISALPRTRETAGYINEYHHNDLIVDARLNDIKTGYENLLVKDWILALDASNNRWNTRFSEGETLNEAARRSDDFIDYLKTQPYESVLVVTHGFIIQAIFGYIENHPLEDELGYDIAQGTYAEFEI